MEGLLILVKFGDKQFLKSFLEKGEVFFNNSEKYVKSQKKEQKDKLEGVEWLMNNGFSKITFNHPTIGKGELIPKNEEGQLIQYNFNLLSHSLYGISQKDFENNSVFKIDNSMLEFGDTAVMIKEPIRFLKAIVKELKNKNIQYQVDIVKYKDLSVDGEIQVTPFIKDLQFKHQNEYRVIIERLNNDTKKISIGSIEDYCEIFSSKEMIEMEWSVNKNNNEETNSNTK